MNGFPKFIFCLAVGYLTTLGLPLTQFAATGGKDLARPAREATNHRDVSQFQIIIQRNIFDPNRGRAEPNQERPPHVETFSFRGAAEKLGKGFDAFFTGDGIPASGTVAVNDEINGFKVREIKLSEVRLIDSNHEVVILQDQTGMTRRDGGPWIKVVVPAIYSSGAQTRKMAVNDNGPYSGQRPAATDHADRANGGGGISTTQADTPELPTPINPAVLATMQARRAQENYTMKKRERQWLTALAVSWIAAASGAAAQTDSTQKAAAEGNPAAQTMESNSITTGPAEKGLTLNLRGVPVDGVLKYLSEAAGFTIIREADTAVQGTVDMVSDTPLNKAEIVLLLDRVLAGRGLAAVQDGRTLTILSIPDAERFDRTPVMVWNNTAASIPPDARIVTEVIPLHSLNPTQVVKDLSSLLPPEAEVVANEGGNAIIMTARPADIRRFTQIIQALDSSGECELKVFSLDYADAKALAQELKDVFTAQDANAGQGNPFQNLTASRGRGAGGTATARRAVIHVNAVSDDQDNAVLVSAPADIMSGIADLIHKLDMEQDDMVQVRIFGLHHADATEVANQMAAIFPDPPPQANQPNSGRGIGARFVAGTMATSPGVEPSDRAKKQATVIAVPDPRTQSVIITASKDTMVQIGNIIAELDGDAAGIMHVYVYYPEHADVADLQGPISDLFGSSSQSPSSSQLNALTQRANQAAQNSSPTTQSASFTAGGNSGGRSNQP